MIHFCLNPKIDLHWQVLAMLRLPMREHYRIRGQEEHADHMVNSLCTAWAGAGNVGIFAILSDNDAYAGHIVLSIEQDLFQQKTFAQLWQFECSVKGYIHKALPAAYDWAKKAGAEEVRIFTAVPGYEKAWCTEKFAEVFGFKKGPTLMIREL